jgi:hypothetical protein
MKALWSVIGLLALAGLPAEGRAKAGGDKVAWEKPDNALGVSVATGKPVCWYFLSGEMLKGSPQAGC